LQVNEIKKDTYLVRHFSEVKGVSMGKAGNEFGLLDRLIDIVILIV